MAGKRRKKSAKRADRPLAVVAQAMGAKPDTIRARLLYHGQRLKGATVAQLVNALQEHSRDKLPPKVLRLLEPPAAAVRINPEHEHTGPPPADPDRMAAGYAALEHAQALAEINVGNRAYGDLELFVLEAATLLPPPHRGRKKR